MRQILYHHRNQSIFYKALLRHIHVVAGRGNQVYLNAINDDRSRHGKAPIPIELPTPTCPVGPDDDEVLAPLPPRCRAANPEAAGRTDGGASSADW